MILGQNKPTAMIDTNLLTVGVVDQAELSIFICNQSGSTDNFTIALVPNGGIENPTMYIASSTPLPGYSVFSAGGICLNSGDMINIKSANGNLSFTATGKYTTP
jgi:hypothetical protein